MFIQPYMSSSLTTIFLKMHIFEFCFIIWSDNFPIYLEDTIPPYLMLLVIYFKINYLLPFFSTYSIFFFVSSFYFSRPFSLVGLGFELRTLHLQSKCSTAWATSVCSGYFGDADGLMNYLPGLALNLDPPNFSLLSGSVASMRHLCLASHSFWHVTTIILLLLALSCTSFIVLSLGTLRNDTLDSLS
jgi:hypothetical protein